MGSDSDPQIFGLLAYVYTSKVFFITSKLSHPTVMQIKRRPLHGQLVTDSALLLLAPMDALTPRCKTLRTDEYGTDGTFPLFQA